MEMVTHKAQVGTVQIGKRADLSVLFLLSSRQSNYSNVCDCMAISDPSRPEPDVGAAPSFSAEELPSAIAGQM